jgi:hypothetical protein
MQNVVRHFYHSFGMFDFKAFRSLMTRLLAPSWCVDVMALIRNFKFVLTDGRPFSFWTLRLITLARECFPRYDLKISAFSTAYAYMKGLQYGGLDSLVEFPHMQASGDGVPSVLDFINTQGVDFQTHSGPTQVWSECSCFLSFLRISEG